MYILPKADCTVCIYWKYEYCKECGKKKENSGKCKKNLDFRAEKCPEYKYDDRLNVINC